MLKYLLMNIKFFYCVVLYFYKIETLYSIINLMFGAQMFAFICDSIKIKIERDFFCGNMEFYLNLGKLLMTFLKIL
jgi:hypothetical protein